jgi:PIN domain nuclease of toxin-antitoxin system
VIALDASALLAYLFRETGHEIVAEKIGESCISTVNLSEVISRFARDGHNPWSVLHQIKQSTVETVPFLAEDAALAAALVPTGRPLGLSLGDRACIALALSRKIPAYTADRIWTQLKVEISIQIIR